MLMDDRGKLVRGSKYEYESNKDRCEQVQSI